MILPGPVGGLIDIAGRAISDTMQRELGQPWLIDPRPGANGIMAGQMFLSAPSDGYTLFFTVSGIMALPFIMKVPFDTVADFKPIAMVGISTALLCVPPQSPASNVAEFVTYAKKNPGKLNYLNSGNGTGAHLLPELLKIKYGLDVTSISYKGLPPGVQDLLANRLDLAMVSTTLVMQHVKAGRLKALAVIGPQRSPTCPMSRPWPSRASATSRSAPRCRSTARRTCPTPIVERLNKAIGRDAGRSRHAQAARGGLHRAAADDARRNGRGDDARARTAGQADQAARHQGRRVVEQVP